MEDHFAIWLSEKEFQTDFIFRVMMLQLRMEKVFDHMPNKGIAQSLVATVWMQWMLCMSFIQCLDGGCS